jgi:hypothetical protein
MVPVLRFDILGLSGTPEAIRELRDELKRRVSGKRAGRFDLQQQIRSVRLGGSI